MTDPRIEAYLEGSFNESELRAFEHELKQSQDLRRQLLLTARFETDLKRLTSARSARRDHNYPSTRFTKAGMKRKIRRDQRPRTTRKRSPHYAIAAASGAVLLIIIGLFTISNSASPDRVPIGRILTLEGASSVQREANSTPLEREQHIYDGDTLVADEQLAVEFNDGSQLTLSQGSLLIDHSQQGKLWELNAGELIVRAHGQPTPLRILTPTARAEVLGTTFRLQVHAIGTSLDVSEGSVRLAARGVPDSGVVVRRGEAAHVRMQQPAALIAANEAAQPLWSIDFAQLQQTPPQWTGRLIDGGLQTVTDVANTTDLVHINHVISAPLPALGATIADGLVMQVEFTVVDNQPVNMTTVHVDPDGNWLGNLFGPLAVQSGRQTATIHFDHAQEILGDQSATTLRQARIKSFSFVSIGAENPLILHRVTLHKAE